MTVPHPLQQLGLFAAQWYLPLDASTQLTRLPPVDAPCGGGYDPCRAPMCTCWKPEPKEDE